MGDMNVPACQHKICNHCARRLPLSAYRCTSKVTGARAGNCRHCHSKSMREWRRTRRLRKLQEFAAAGSWRTDRMHLNKLAGQLMYSFGGPQELAKEYAHQLREHSEAGRHREASRMMLTVVRLLSMVD